MGVFLFPSHFIFILGTLHVAVDHSAMLGHELSIGTVDKSVFGVSQLVGIVAIVAL